MRQIHVGDVGTLYRIPISAEDIPSDPATATTREMIFSLPNDMVLTKDLDGGSPVNGQVLPDSTPPSRWYFSYTVQADSGAGSPPDFHAAEGAVNVQVHLVWPDATEWHSDVFSGDVDGLNLTILANLEA